MAKHYIRKDGNNVITKAFSDRFETPLEDDVLIADNAPRHYHLDLFDENQRYKLKYTSGKIRNRTEAAMYPETKAVFDVNKAKLANSVNDDMNELIQALITKGTITTDDLSTDLKTRYTNRS